MEKDTPLNEQESLAIIHSMITAAKNEIKADAFIFIFWGWLVFTASLTQFFLIKIEIEFNYLPWILMPIGGIITIIYFFRKNKKARIKTHVGENLKYIWTAFTAALLIIMFFNTSTWLQIFPIIMALYGIGLFLSGGALQFKPLIMGGIFCWICAIIAFKVQNDYQLLIFALGVLGGYLIPGYLLRINTKNRHVRGS